MTEQMARFVEGTQEELGEFDFLPQPWELPRGMEVCMVSTGVGSDTRVMVKEVMEWSKKCREGADGSEGVFEK